MRWDSSFLKLEKEIFYTFGCPNHSFTEPSDWLEDQINKVQFYVVLISGTRIVDFHLVPFHIGGDWSSSAPVFVLYALDNFEPFIPVSKWVQERENTHFCNQMLSFQFLLRFWSVSIGGAISVRITRYLDNRTILVNTSRELTVTDPGYWENLGPSLLGNLPACAHGNFLSPRLEGYDVSWSSAFGDTFTALTCISASDVGHWTLKNDLYCSFKMLAAWYECIEWGPWLWNFYRYLLVAEAWSTGPCSASWIICHSKRTSTSKCLLEVPKGHLLKVSIMKVHYFWET